MIALTCGSVFDVCAINRFYERGGLPAQQTCCKLPVVSTVISSRIPFTSVHYTSNRYAGHQPAGDLYGPHTPWLTSLLTAGCQPLHLATLYRKSHGQIAILAAIRPRRMSIYLVGLEPVERSQTLISSHLMVRSYPWDSGALPLELHWRKMWMFILGNPLHFWPRTFVNPRDFFTL